MNCSDNEWSRNTTNTTTDFEVFTQYSDNNNFNKCKKHVIGAFIMDKANHP